MVYDVMLDPAGSGVGNPGYKIRHSLPIGCFDQQPARGLRNDDVIVLVAMPGGFSASFKSPLGNDYPIIVYLHGRPGGFSGFGHCFPMMFANSMPVPTSGGKQGKCEIRVS